MQAQAQVRDLGRSRPRPGTFKETGLNQRPRLAQASDSELYRSRYKGATTEGVDLSQDLSGPFENPEPLRKEEVLSQDLFQSRPKAATSAEKVPSKLYLWEHAWMTPATAEQTQGVPSKL